MKEWIKNNKALLSVAFAIGLTYFGVPVYLAKPVADTMAESAAEHAQAAD